MPKGQGRKFKPHDTQKRVSSRTYPPRKFDTQRVKRIVDCLSIDGTKEEACVLGCISTVTFDERYANDRKLPWEIQEGFNADGSPARKKVNLTFKEIVDHAYTDATMRCRKSLYNGVDNSPRIALDVLEKRDPRYSPKQDVQLAGNITVLFGKQNKFLKPDPVDLGKISESQPKALKAKSKK